jgi:hypothetical protein
MASFLGDLVRGVAASSNQFPEAMRNRLLMQRDEERQKEERSRRDREELFRVFNVQSSQLRESAQVIQNDIDALHSQARDAYAAGIDPPPGLYDAIEQKTEERDNLGAQANEIAQRLLQGYPTAAEQGTWISPSSPEPAAAEMVETEDGDVVQEVQYDPAGAAKMIAEQNKAKKREQQFQKALITIKGIAAEHGSEAALQYAEAYLPNMTDEEKAKVEAAFVAPSDGNWTPERIEQMARVVQTSPNGGELLKQVDDEDAKEQILFLIMDQSGRIGDTLTAGERKDLMQTAKAIFSLGDLLKTIEKHQDSLGIYAARLTDFQRTTVGAVTRGKYAPEGWQKDFELRADIVAEMDKVRQEVGKALEGGVLRKEDEEKYKKILPTLEDEPTTAKRKVAMMLKGLKRQWKIASQIQVQYGAAPAIKDSDLYDIVLPIDGATADIDELQFFIDNGWDDVYQPYMEERFPLDEQQ